MNTRERLDEALVRRGLAQSRSRARDAVLRGTVSVGGRPVVRPGHKVDADDRITIADPAARYVSRSALKLAAGLSHFGFDVAGSTGLDIGASTGGFTQVLLEHGARHVVAVDVGHGQMDPLIAGDPRVASLEGLNARHLSVADLNGVVPDVVVADVSFISLKLALPAALALAAPAARCVLLVKPQFEAGREAVGKGGLLRDPAMGEAIAGEMRDWLDAQPGWRALGVVPSPIDGGDGNREFLLGGVRQP